MKVLEVQSYTSSLHLSHYWPHYRLPQGWPARLTGALGPLNRCGGQKSCCVSFDCKGKEDNYPLQLYIWRAGKLYLWPSFVILGKLTSMLKLIPAIQNEKMTFRTWAIF